MSKKKKRKKEEESVSGLLAKIERIEEKLNLLSVMGKSMPVIILTTIAILGSVTYLLTVSEVPQTDQLQGELPQTGSYEKTEDFVLLYPEQGAEITLPDKVKGLSLDGFYADNTVVTFFAQKKSGSTFTLGTAQKGYEPGEYKINWQAAPEGEYFLWATIQSGQQIVQSETIEISIK